VIRRNPDHPDVHVVDRGEQAAHLQPGRHVHHRVEPGLDRRHSSFGSSAT